MNYLYTLIPVLPLVVSFILMLFPDKFHGKGHKLVVPAVAMSFVLTVFAFVTVLQQGPIEIHLYQFLASGKLSIDFGFYIDQLTVLILLLVTGVSSVVQVFASRYMIGDKRHSRFFALTALFTAAMTLLVMSSNLMITFVFWELMGICSYLLVSHYSQRPNAAAAATKVFLVNSVADVGLLVGVILTYNTFGTLDIPQILLIAESGVELPSSTITLITLCLFCGAVGKSAQMPAHVWLPYAMEAPTPVSALIHAATMVNAGPFLLVRLSPVFVLAPTTMTVIATIGGITALFAAVVSLTQTDVKRTLAYSTISQLGFMTMLCGVGAFVAAIFHLIAHGCFKAFLFLSTGNALAGTHRHLEHDHGDNAPKRASLFIGALFLSLLPALIIFSGPYKALWSGATQSNADIALWIVGAATVFCTAIYLFKSITNVFSEGPTGAPDGESRVKPVLFSLRYIAFVAIALAAMIGVLVVLWRWFAVFLSPIIGVQSSSEDVAFSAYILIPIGIALAGWLYAFWLSRKTHSSSSSVLKNRLYVFFLNKGYFDEIYEAFIVRPMLSFSHWAWRKIDQGFIDRCVVGLGQASTAIAQRLGYLDSAVDHQVTSVGKGSVSIANWLGRFVDTAGINNAVDGLGRGADASGHAAKRYEPHTMQHNLLVVVFWLVAALGFFYWLAG